MISTASYAFGSIIDIYNSESPTIGGGSPGSGYQLHGVLRAQQKLGSILQTYFYNLAPSPWSPPSIYLSLFQALESLEGVLSQLGLCRDGMEPTILAVVNQGLYDLLQEVELLLMSSKVDGPRDTRWWDKFSKKLRNEDNGNITGGQQTFVKARENVAFYIWVGKWVLRVGVNGGYTRRMIGVAHQLEEALGKMFEDQLSLYVWDEEDGEGECPINRLRPIFPLNTNELRQRILIFVLSFMSWASTTADVL